MPFQRDFDNKRRILIAAGTANYQQLGEYWNLSMVPEELKRISALFSQLGYVRELAEISIDPTSKEFQVGLDRWSNDELQNGDLVVFYYTGHGQNCDDRFYLLTCDSEPSKKDKSSLLTTSAVAAEDLARYLTQNTVAKRVLIILDTCFSGAGAAQLMGIANRLASIKGESLYLYVIAAAGSKQEAKESAFISALEETFSKSDARLGGATQKYWCFEDVYEEIQGFLKKFNPAQQIEGTVHLGRREEGEEEVGCLLFPNPRYRPEVPYGLDLESHHWVSKARGAEAMSGVWYFTGRTTALCEVATWLQQERSGLGAVIITGGAGSGKSALLSRIVTLSDPIYRRSVLAEGHYQIPDALEALPEGVIDVAIHARNKLLADIVRQIALKLDLRAKDAPTLIEEIEKREKKTVIVVDALDESDDSERIISHLLRPLVSQEYVFLLVGSRPDTIGQERRFRALGELAREIDLDNPHYIGSDDIVHYVKRRLLAELEPTRYTPYRDKPELASKVAEGVARRAGNVFLVARTAVQFLLNEDEPIDISINGWTDSLPTAIDDAFSKFLSRLNKRKPDGLTSDIVRALLLPLAFCEGAGLPWAGIWAPLASALSNMHLTDDHIAIAQNYAAAFIVEDLESGQSVYRLYHNCLADFLKSDNKEEVATTQTHRIIAIALQELVRTETDSDLRDWSKAPPYVLTHLPAHALKGGCLNELCDDLTFLVFTDPIRMLWALAKAQDQLSKRVYSCYSLIWQQLSESPPATRSAYLQMAAWRQGYLDLVAKWKQAPWKQPWSVSWAHWTPTCPHVKIVQKRNTNQIALAELDGYPFVVFGGRDEVVQAWDLTSYQGISKSFQRHVGGVRSVATGTLDDGRSVVVSGGDDGKVQLWDLRKQREIDEHEEHKGSVYTVACAVLNGQALVASGGKDSKVCIWDLSGNRIKRELLKGHEGEIRTVTLGMLAQTPVAVSGDSDGTIRIWNLNDYQEMIPRLLGHKGNVRSLAITTLNNGHTLVASGGDDGRVQLWDLSNHGGMCQ